MCEREIAFLHREHVSRDAGFGTSWSMLEKGDGEGGKGGSEDGLSIRGWMPEEGSGKTDSAET
jgi:hypothetical protein